MWSLKISTGNCWGDERKGRKFEEDTVAMLLKKNDIVFVPRLDQKKKNVRSIFFSWVFFFIVKKKKKIFFFSRIRIFFYLLLNS